MTRLDRQVADLGRTDERLWVMLATPEPAVELERVLEVANGAPITGA
jgi:hypothetical protein